jgi:hypothetical protein
MNVVSESLEIVRSGKRDAYPLIRKDGYSFNACIDKILKGLPNYVSS